MARYLISIPVTTLECYEVEADSRDEAIEIVASGEGTSTDTDFWQADQDQNNWKVKELD